MEDQPNYRWDSKNILVVEDDESSAFLLGTFLKETGASISFTTDGKATQRVTDLVYQMTGLKEIQI